jgi:hypothetical protein
LRSLYWWECKLVQPLWKAVWRFLKKLKIELPYNPVVPLLGIYPKECKSRYSRDTYPPMFIASYGNKPDLLQLMNGSRKCDILTLWSFSQPLGIMATYGFKVNGCN